jgi:hypothetical protein
MFTKHLSKLVDLNDDVKPEEVKQAALPQLTYACWIGCRIYD